jgi:hypothetical protein
MRLPSATKRPITLMCVPLLALALSACGKTISTSAFTGEQHDVAQAISNLQSDATAVDEKNICANDLAAAIVSSLGGTKGCETAIKNQLAEIDNLETTIPSVKITAPGKTATAAVKSIYAGKAHVHSVSLVKEGGKWKASGLQ